MSTETPQLNGSGDRRIVMTRELAATVLKSLPSNRWWNAKTSPRAPHPKHLKRLESGYTWKLGVLSAWNGQLAENEVPDFRSSSLRPITSTGSIRARSSSMTAAGITGALRGAAA